ncbi:alpha/beta hydrolase [bacterium]|nr:alpha/beta hydrolase [bacterium]
MGSLLRAKDFRSHGVKIHYTVEGSGQPVILIHGLASSAAINWRMPGIVARLAKDYQVVALDCRGHGRSDKPKQDQAYGRAMVQDVAALMDHLRLKNAHIVGYSMGGMIRSLVLIRGRNPHL